jgi:Lrp/AsnC family transcriptional regulator for asnA, asnC and gidA
VTFYESSVLSNICPIITGTICDYVYKHSVLMEKCLYNICLIEQAFTGRVLGNRALGMSKLETSLIEKIDDMDIRILSVLQEDSRLSFNKIARKLGISVGTAFNRVRNLEKKGILKGYTAIVDSGKLGYSLTAIIMVQAEGTYLTDIENEIAKTANVVAVYDITGDYDATVIAKFKDRASLNAFIKNLLAVPHIKRTVTNVALNVIKENRGVKL